MSAFFDPRRLLATPLVYASLMNMLGADDGMTVFVRDHLRPRAGARVLDLGCGPGRLYPHLPAVDYYGIDSDAAYLNRARTLYPQARFKLGDVSGEVFGDGEYDLIVACGLLHHLPDDAATRVLSACHGWLRRGGRLVTLDCVFEDGQNFLSRLLVAGDRGGFVRSGDGYLALARACFPEAALTIRHDLLRVPYSHAILQMRTMTAAIRYDPHDLDVLASLEERHFWFRARRRIIVDALQRWFPGPRRYLEIGSGTGYVAQGIAESFPDWQVVASDALAQHASMLNIDVRAIPFSDSFDVVGAYDVLEHVEDDGGALEQMRSACRTGGGVLLTVPQHPFLWSPADVYAGHCRRYRRRDVGTLLRRHGFELLHTTSFNTLNLPLFFLRSRFLRATGQRPGTAMPAAPLNWLLERGMEFDRRMIAGGLALPFGASLLVAARRKD